MILTWSPWLAIFPLAKFFLFSSPLFWVIRKIATKEFQQPVNKCQECGVLSGHAPKCSRSTVPQ